jgi:glucan biosynthesis protein C
VVNVAWDPFSHFADLFESYVAREQRTPSWWLTLFNDAIHAFRMQVFFVISGYFSYMLYLRYPLQRWWTVRVERVGIPMLTAIPLLTLPQFIMLQYVNGRAQDWHTLSLYDKFNTLVWELISHLWFLLVLVVLTTVSMWLFRRIKSNAARLLDNITLGKLSLAFLAFGIIYAAFRRLVFIIYPDILRDALFNFAVMQSLFYIPFFLLGALTFINPRLKSLFINPSLPVLLLRLSALPPIC